MDSCSAASLASYRPPDTPFDLNHVLNNNNDVIYAPDLNLKQESQNQPFTVPREEVVPHSASLAALSAAIQHDFLNKFRGIKLAITDAKRSITEDILICNNNGDNCTHGSGSLCPT